MMNETAIRIDNLTKVYKKTYNKMLKEEFISLLTGRPRSSEVFLALNGVSFEVEKGEFFSIIGRNGAGKSTLFKIISGIVKPNSGTVRSVGKISPMIELNAGLYDDLTGRENAILNGIILGIPRKQMEGNFQSVLEFSGLHDFIDTAVKYYSTGMKARLGFSIAINVDADILLIDEVLAVGDLEFRKKCYDKMEEMKKKATTIVYISHNMDSVLRMSDRVMWLNKGKVMKIGKPEEVVQDYRDSLQ